MSTRALVLSGGGVAGIAWETGLVAGLAEAGTDISNADLIVGTSAGSVVGSQIACGVPASEMLEKQLAPATEAIGQGSQVDMTALAQLGQKFVNVTEITPEVLRDIGALALSAKTASETRWIASFEGRLAGLGWPETPALKITAIDVESGEFKAWDRTSDVPLATAVASSCAVPALFPPVTIHGRRYMDGGMRSSHNSDLAQRYDRVLLVSFTGAFRRRSEVVAERLNREIDNLRQGGCTVETIRPDDASVAAIGVSLMDPAVRIPCAEAGHQQGRGLAARVRAFWSGEEPTAKSA